MAQCEEDMHESNARYAEMYARYMESRAEKHSLQKMVDVLTTQKKELEEKAR